MSQAVLVGGQISPWMNAFRFLGPLAIVGGAVCAFFPPPLAAGLFTAGVLGTVIVELGFWSVRRKRRWVEDSGNGIVVTDRSGVRRVSDEQVVSLAYYKRHVHNEGMLKGDWRHLIVWVEGVATPIEMKNYLAVGEADPLSALIGRLLDNSLERATTAFDRGGQLQGDGWALDRQGLLLPRQPLPEQVRFEDVSAVDVVDEQFCIWRHGVDEAIAKLPQRSRDLHLLKMLLSERIQTPAEDTSGLTASGSLGVSNASNPYASPSPATFEGEGLGRILFERRPGLLLKTCVGMAIPILFLSGLFCALIPDSRVAGVVMLALCPILVLVAWHCQLSLFRCHERGVYKRGLGFVRQLRYADVAALTYSATRHYHNGAYVGTHLGLRFDPLPGVPTKAIAYNTTVKAADDALDSLRDRIASILSVRMGEEVAQGRVAVWTANLSFTPEGIVYRPNTLLGGRKEPVLLPYDRFGGYDFEQGKFRLWEKDRPKPIVTENSSQKNFYPGYFLLLATFYGGEATE